MTGSYVTTGGETVDLIAWTQLGKTRGVTEQILELNPGLADHGPVLPAGITVLLPTPPAKQTVRVVPRIWS